MANRKQKRLQPELSYTVDPLSDLVSGHEMTVWRSNPTTRKIHRYLTRWRSQMVDALSEGFSLNEHADASAMKTTEFVSKAQILKDILTLEAKDIAQFYGLDEPSEEKKK